VNGAGGKNKKPVPALSQGCLIAKPSREPVRPFRKTVEAFKKNRKREGSFHVLHGFEDSEGVIRHPEKRLAAQTRGKKMRHMMPEHRLFMVMLGRGQKIDDASGKRSKDDRTYKSIHFFVTHTVSPLH
jgi:hypothetical protein